MQEQLPRNAATRQSSQCRATLPNRLDCRVKTERARIARPVAGKRRAMHRVARRPDRRRNGFEQVSGVPCAMHENIGCHFKILPLAVVSKR
mgnify:CR=1 FL=1